MTSNRYPPRPTIMAMRLGQHLLLSLGVATAAALIATLPGLWSGAVSGHREMSLPAAEATMPRLALLPNGKIADRLDEAEGDERTANPQLTPAALAMPMSLGWPAGAGREATQSAALRQGAGAARSSGYRGASPQARVAASARPLVIPPPAAATVAVEAVPATRPARDDSWSRFVVAPATKLVDAVSGAAGDVQAAGSRGLSQAVSLLPHW